MPRKGRTLSLFRVNAVVLNCSDDDEYDDIADNYMATLWLISIEGWKIRIRTVHLRHQFCEVGNLGFEN